MPVEDALRVLVNLRTDQHVVVTNQGSARLWPRLSKHPTDFNYNPSNMGGAVPLALGIALACPDREIIVLSGDGSLLMNLGCLVTAVSSGVENLTVILLDNGIYEVTGGQATPAAGDATDFAQIASASGFPSVATYDSLTQWRQGAAEFLKRAGPRFASLIVDGIAIDCWNDHVEPTEQQIMRLRKALL